MTQLYFASQLHEFGTTLHWLLAVYHGQQVQVGLRDWSWQIQTISEHQNPIPGATIPSGWLARGRSGGKTDELSKVHKLVNLK